jgi:glyoxylase-like metal-dependent hydrolase (beta-lactamase superfamily II)
MEDGDFFDAEGELYVLHTPGHTPGSMSLYHEQWRLLFCGDLLFNANPLTGKRGLQYPMSFISVNDRQVRESVARIGELDIDILCPGHGPPITENAGEQIRALIAREGR